jgi:hypothetical protein
MPRTARPLLRLLALLLLLQWVGWPLPNLRATALAGEPTVICSAEGMRTVLLGPDGQPVEPSPGALSCCLLCQAPLAGAALLPPPALPSPRMMAAPDVSMTEAVRRLSFHPPPSTHRSRAPPLS